MQVKEILRVKGNRLLSTEPGGRASDAVRTMADQNLGSLVVLDQGRMVGMLTFHELLGAIAQRNGSLFWSSDIQPTWEALRRQVLAAKAGGETVRADCAEMRARVAEVDPVQHLLNRRSFLAAMVRPTT